MIPVDPSVVQQSTQAQQQGPAGGSLSQTNSQDVSNFEQAMQQDQSQTQATSGLSGPSEPAESNMAEKNLPPGPASTQPSNAADATSQTTQAQSTPPTDPTGQSEKMDSPADVMMNGLQQVSDNYVKQTKSIQDATQGLKEGRTLDPSEMLSIEYSMAQISIEQDVTSKVADDASQGIQTLFKNQ